MRFLLALLVVLCGFPPSGEAIACSCAAPAEGEQFQRAHAVFVARVVSAGRFATTEGIERRAQMVPLRRIKGNPWAMPYVSTTVSGCGLPLTKGSTYLIFADAEGKTSACSGSRWIDGKYLTVDQAVSDLNEELLRAEKASK